MSGAQRAAIWLAALAVAVLLLYLLRGILFPFVAGMAVAYFLDPLADRLEARKWPRTLAALAILAGFLAVVGIALVVLIPLLQAQVVGFADRLPAYVAALRELAGPLVERLREVMGEKDIGSTLGGEAAKALSWLGGLVGGLAQGAGALIGLLSVVFITPLVGFYLLRDWDLLVARVDSWLPRAAVPTVRRLAAETDAMLAGFVRGQATVCLTLACYYGAGLSLVGVEFGLLIGIGTGLMAFIPYVAMGIGFTIAFGISLVQFGGWEQPALVCLVFAIGQLGEGNFLTPKLVGERVGLHPVWVIFALFAGGTLFGFTGVLLAVPVAAVIGVLVRFGLGRYLDSALYRGA